MGLPKSKVLSKMTFGAMTQAGEVASTYDKGKDLGLLRI